MGRRRVAIDLRNQWMGDLIAREGDVRGLKKTGAQKVA